MRDTGVIVRYARIERERFDNKREIRSADKTEPKGFGNSIERGEVGKKRGRRSTSSNFTGLSVTQAWPKAR